MKGTIIYIIVNAISLYAGAQLLEGVNYTDPKGLAIAAILLAVANTFVKPILKFLSFPIRFVTLGLFMLVINAGMIMLMDYFASGYAVNGFLNALILGVIVGLLNSFICRIISRGDDK